MYFMFRRWTLISSPAMSSSTMASKSACTRREEQIFSKTTVLLQQLSHMASSSASERSMGLSMKEVLFLPSRQLDGNRLNQQSLNHSRTMYGIVVSVILDLGTSINFSKWHMESTSTWPHFLKPIQTPVKHASRAIKFAISATHRCDDVPCPVI